MFDLSHFPSKKTSTDASNNFLDYFARHMLFTFQKLLTNDLITPLIRHHQKPTCMFSFFRESATQISFRMAKWQLNRTCETKDTASNLYCRISLQLNKFEKSFISRKNAHRILLDSPFLFPQWTPLKMFIWAPWNINRVHRDYYFNAN